MQSSELEDALFEIVQDIWTTLLGFEVQRVSPANGVGLARGDATVTGCIQISGAWKGTVVMEFSAALAARVASGWLETGPTVSAEDIQDVVGELVNILGGNVKALLPSASHLSLPVVAEGTDYELTVLKSRVFGRVHLACGGDSLRVMLLVRNDALESEQAGA